MRILQDLPPELLLPIFAGAFQPNGLDDYGRPADSKLHLTRLSRVCRQFHALIGPVLWRDVCIKEIETFSLFYDSICNHQSNSGILVQDFTFHYDRIKFGGGDHEPWTTGPTSIRSNRSHMNVQELLQRIFERLTKLRHLWMYSHWPFSEPSLGPEWLFNLYCDGTLQSILIHRYVCRPEAFNRVFAMKNLQVFEMMSSYSEENWLPDALNVTTNLKKLRIAGSHPISATTSAFYSPGTPNGVPNRVLKGLLSCCTDIEDLSIDISESACDGGELDSMLGNLNDRSRLKQLYLNCRYDLKSKLSGLSYLRYLTRLTVQSTLLWPLRNSWEVRRELYKNLPPTLTSLSIFFPATVNPHYGSEPYDGVFQLNVEEGSPDMERFRDQIIPETRYTWLLNLLKTNEDEAGGQTPCLPCLKDILLIECSSIGNFFDFGRSSGLFSLPDEIAQRFLERSIYISIHVSTYEVLEYEDRRSEPSDDSRTEDDG